MGHKSKSDNCQAYDPDCGVVAFRSHEHPLSNFYPCKISYRDEDYASLEHAFQVTKAISLGDLEIAENIKAAPNAFFAKKISKQLDKYDTTKWESTNVSIMEELIRIKADTVPEFRDSIIESSSFILAEATSNLFWASGLNPQLPEVTKPKYWPGRNTLGTIIMKVRLDLAKKNVSKCSSEVLDDGVMSPEQASSSLTTPASSPVQPRSLNDELDSSDISPSPVSLQHTKQTSMDKYTVSITQIKRKPSASPESDKDSKKDSKINKSDKDG